MDATKTADIHLWWNGYEHSFGSSEAEANANLVRFSGCTAEECEGDGWEMVPDDSEMKDEVIRGDGAAALVDAGHTARQYAEQMAAEMCRDPGCGLAAHGDDVPHGHRA